jgi:hypothetical protein
VINLIKHIHEQTPWLYNRRFRFSVLVGLLAMLAQAVPIDWVRWCGLILLLSSVLLVFDAVFLLPHEKQRLKKIRKHIGTLDIDKAKKLLSCPVCLPSVPFSIQRRFLQARAGLYQKDLLGAYNAVVSAGKYDLLPKEAVEYRCLKGRIYWEAGNVRDFIQLFENEKIDPLSRNTSTSLAVLKSHWYVAKKDLLNAKQVLESVIATKIDKETKILLYNELAVFEGRSGNKEEQISHLYRAFELLKKQPQPIYYESVIHNLAINLLREERRTEAHQVMQIYRNLIDLKNVWQCLFFCNDQLLFARETGSQEMIDKAHIFRKKHLTRRLPALQEIALRISELTMVRNDHQNMPHYFDHVLSLVEDIDQLPPNEQLQAFLKITEDIRFEYEKKVRLGDSARDLKRLDDLYANVADRAIALKSVIEKELQKIPPALPEIRKQWMLHRHNLLKLKSGMEKGINKSELQKIFNNLEEMARLWKDKEYDHGEIEALLIICDEFIAFRKILKGPFHNDFISRALNAYQAAENLLKDRLEMPEFQQYMIGMAYFALNLGIGEKTVFFWFQAAHKHPLQIRHYAEWFRQQYLEVQILLKNNRQR